MAAFYWILKRYTHFTLSSNSLPIYTLKRGTADLESDLSFS